MSRLRPGLAAALAILVAGCAHETASDRAPRPDPVARLAPAGGPIWREDLGDPVLGDLLRRADAGALDIKIALARLERAQADADVAGAVRRPQVTVGAFGAAGGRTLSSHREAGVPTLEAAYDFDISGQLARLRAAALSERDASAADVANARLLVAAATARAYVALCAADEGLAAAGRRQAAAQATLVLTRARATEGNATGQDLERFAAAADDAAVAEQTARAEAEAQAAGLKVLLGGADAPARRPGCLPGAAPLPASIPADLVDRRPDVQAALARLKAADQRRAAAVAAARPQFQISAVLGAPDATLATLLDTKSLAWAIAGKIGETVLDGGAGRARLRGTSAEADAADLAYRKAVLEGWSELRVAGVRAAAAQARLAVAGKGETRAASALKAVWLRHAEGAADGLAVAAVEAQAEDAGDALRQAEVGAAEARIQRALAGGGQ